MSSTLLTLVCGAVLLSAGLTFALIRLSRRLHLIAEPRSDRWHKTPTPDTGGVAVFLTCALFYLLFAWKQHSVVAAASAVIAALGFLDDRLRLRPLTKFLAQSLCVAVVIAQGVVFSATPWLPVNLALTFLWIAGLTNAFNLIDNMDGLCGGVTVIIAASRCWFGLKSGDAGGALMFALVGAAFFGFLLFNFRPARIFLGDCGSMFAGFTLSALAVANPIPRTRVFLSALFFPALTFLYPIFDTVLVALLRRAAGRPISVGGRDHSSHRLVSLGLTEQTAVWLLWGLTALGSAAGCLTYSMPLAVVAIGVPLVAGISVFGVFLGTLPSFAPPDDAPIRSRGVRRMIPTLRAGITLVVDVLLSGVAVLGAFLFLGDSTFLNAHWNEFLFILPVVMLGHAAASLGLRTYRLCWRWFGGRDLLDLALCVLLGLALSLLTLWISGTRGYTLAFAVLYVIFAFALAVGLRAAMSLLWRTVPASGRLRRAAIIGSSAKSELLVLVLRRERDMNAQPVLILDPDPAAARTRIRGVPVLHLGGDSVQLLQRANVELVVMPGNGSFTQEHRRIAQDCRAAGLAVEALEVSMGPLPPEPEFALPVGH